MKGLFIIFLGYGLNDPGQQVSLEIIEVKEFDDDLLALFRTALLLSLAPIRMNSFGVINGSSTL
jgi:hypothetical protein